MKALTLKSLSSLVIVIGILSVATAHAGENWKKKHPRRAEVNKRLNNQQKRVDNGLADGKLTPAQAEKIQSQDSAIRAQEQRDASGHNGHITKAEQRQLNREENGVSREIRRDEHKNEKPAQAPAPQAPAPQAPANTQ